MDLVVGLLLLLLFALAVVAVLFWYEEKRDFANIVEDGYVPLEGGETVYES